MSRIYVCPKCGRPHSSKERKESLFCRDCGTFLPKEEKPRASYSRKGDSTHAEMIADVIRSLPEPFTRGQIIDAVVENYSVLRPINRDSLGTDIAGCCVNLRSHESLPDLPYLLVSVGRGLYRRYPPGKDEYFRVPEKVKPRPRTRISLKTEPAGIFKDYAKAERIGQVLHQLFRTKTGFFKGYEMPEYVLPQTIVERTKEHALYLTYVISIDYQTDAVKLWRNARRMYQNNPECFDPESVMDMDLGYLSRIVKNIGARYPANGAEAWKRISAILLQKYQGDPRNVTPRPSLIGEVRRKIDEFPHLRGPKLSNFYIRAMGEKGLFRIEDLDQLDIPVDVQVARFTFYTGCLELKGGSFTGGIHEPPTRPAIEDVWRQVAKVLDIAPWELDEPIWTIGSKLCVQRNCGPCPVKDVCDRNFDIEIRENKVYWRQE